MEYIIAGASLFVAVCTAGGLIVTWRKNGRDQRERDERQTEEQAKRDQEIASNQQSILKTLEDRNTGLAALNNKVGEMKTHCASVTASYGERINAVERDVRELKKREE